MSSKSYLIDFLKRPKLSFTVNLKINLEFTHFRKTLKVKMKRRSQGMTEDEKKQTGVHVDIIEKKIKLEKNFFS